MKNNIRKITLILGIVVLLVFVNSVNSYALTREINTKNINELKEEQRLDIENLSFENIVFKDYSSTSTKAFGLTGKIFNSSNNIVSYKTKVVYYDYNYNIIAQESSYGNALTGLSIFNQMSSLNILQEHSVSEICYYTLQVTVEDNITSGWNSSASTSTPSINDKYSSKDYVIDKYDINIIVNENNTFDVTETITAYFNIPKHGIFRTIPLQNEIKRLDGTTDKNRAQVTNVSVNSEYTTSRENGNFIIKIGSANYTLTGEQTYVIKYTYNLGKDPSKEYDEIYYNIIGTEEDTPIGNVTFSITMPKAFDASKLGFSLGREGSTDNSNIIYNVSDNKITGSYNGILDRGETITIRCELPEGYFVGAGLEINKTDFIMFGIPVILLIISILLWNKYGRDELVIETVEFYPPEGLNSLDVGFLYRGKAENKDVTSLLVYLANKGYIQIIDKQINSSSQKISLSDESKKAANEKIIELQNKIEEERKNNPDSKKIKYYENMLDIYKNIDAPIDYQQFGVEDSIKELNSRNGFVIKKIKDYDGTDRNEKLFMEGLFKNGRTEVTDKMLNEEFYITNSKILRNKNSEENTNKIFEKSSKFAKTLIILMVVVTYLLITIAAMQTYGESELLIFALVFPGVGLYALLTMISRGKDIATKIFGAFCGITFGGIPWLFTVLPAITQDITYSIGYILGSICIVGMIICIVHLQKRTKYGNEILGKLRGFKNFLETVEKERLEVLVMENPNYFYDILPYTYVLDVSDKWIKKFESISMEEPSWYNSNESFNIQTFGRFMNSTMTSAQKSMTSIPVSSSGGSYSGSGGSSSGGGSSGGGSGGGRVGSW